MSRRSGKHLIIDRIQLSCGSHAVVNAHGSMNLNLQHSWKWEALLSIPFGSSTQLHRHTIESPCVITLLLEPAGCISGQSQHRRYLAILQQPRSQIWLDENTSNATHRPNYFHPRIFPNIWRRNVDKNKYQHPKNRIRLGRVLSSFHKISTKNLIWKPDKEIIRKDNCKTTATMHESIHSKWSAFYYVDIDLCTQTHTRWGFPQMHVGSYWKQWIIAP